MKNFLILILFFSANNILGCFIETYPKAIIISNKPVQKQHSVIKNTDCNTETTLKFLKSIQEAKGVITERLASELLNQKIKLKPSSVKIINFNEYARESIFNNRDWYFFANIKSGLSDSIIGVDSNESFSVSCSSCNETGNKNIKLSIYNPLSSSKRSVWISGKTLIKTQALVARRNIGFNEPSITPSTFSLKEVYSDKPEQFFVNQSKLPFYKVNKSIKKGSPLKFNDLHSIYLIKSGKPATVLYNSKTLKLSTTAMPLRSARLGETVPLKNQKTNKTIIGKVIDFNKVAIEL